jgi:dihydrolipoamide dehydrogenase
VGGACLNVGCIPTKALLRSAEVLSLMQHAGEFGVSAGEPGFDWTKVQARKAKVVAQMTNGVRVLLRRAGVQIVEGEARFVRADTLAVQSAAGQETVTAAAIIIATGSRSMQVPIPGLDGPNVLDSTGALALETLPERLCIIGGGAIGLEFASLYNAFGVAVTVIEMLPRLAPLMDASIGEGLAWSLERQGVEVLVGSRVTGVVHEGDLCRVAVTTPDGAREIVADKVLSAIGRTPHVEGLGLELLGLKPGRKGIQVDNHMRTAVPGVYAVGDVAAEGPMLAHVASHQGVVAVEDALGRPAAMDYRAVPACIFTVPEAAGVGLTEEEARAAGYEVQTGIFGLANNGKAVAMGEADGFVKVVAEAAHGAVLGLHVVGPHASDLVLEGGLAITLESTLHELTHTIHPHPALGEAIAEAALAVRHEALHLPRP